MSKIVYLADVLPEKSSDEKELSIDSLFNKSLGHEATLTFYKKTESLKPRSYIPYHTTGPLSQELYDAYDSREEKPCDAGYIIYAYFDQFLNYYSYVRTFPPDEYETSYRTYFCTNCKPECEHLRINNRVCKYMDSEEEDRCEDCEHLGIKGECYLADECGDKIVEHATILQNGYVSLPILHNILPENFHLEIRYSDEITIKLRNLYEQHVARQDDAKNTPAPSPQKPKPETPEKSSKKESSKKSDKKGTTMLNSMNFGINPIQDGNAIGTLFGVAVKSSEDTWRVYDPKKGKLTDLGDNQVGDFPLWEVPALKVRPGDTIIHNGSYYYVHSIAGANIKAVNIASGQSEDIILATNLLGFNIYQKVLSFGNILGYDQADTELSDKLLMMMALSQGGDMNSLLPILLIKGKHNLSMEKLLILSMMNNSQYTDQTNQLPQLLLMRELLGDDDIDIPSVSPTQPEYEVPSDIDA